MVQQDDTNEHVGGNAEAAQADLRAIVEAAARLGVEMDESEALQWLTAVAGDRSGDEVTFDSRTGVFGHRVSMLDFSPGELERFRAIGRIVEFEDEPGVETALALSGSAAQSKIQSFPGDCDYFERVNIFAPSRAEACATLARIMREKVLKSAVGPAYRMIEIKFGSYPCDGTHGGRTVHHGSPIAWTPLEVAAGAFQLELPDGTGRTVAWDEVSSEPGWCKLDWVVADPVRHTIANASNMLDVTWEAPDGTISPLDGYLDPYFQEVYLDAESIPIFSKLAKHVSADALEDYVEQLEKEIRKYLTKDINYGKAAKRMYNVFRLTGRYQEAAFIRELFDEPTTVLYQVWSLIRTIDDVTKPGAEIEMASVTAQADELILHVVDVLEGEHESEIVRHLLRLRDALARHVEGTELSAQAEAARAEVINIVNNFFFSKLSGVPSISEYMGTFRPAEG